MQLGRVHPFVRCNYDFVVIGILRIVLDSLRCSSLCTCIEILHLTGMVLNFCKYCTVLPRSSVIVDRPTQVISARVDYPELKLAVLWTGSHLSAQCWCRQRSRQVPGKIQGNSFISHAALSTPNTRNKSGMPIQPQHWWSTRRRSMTGQRKLQTKSIGQPTDKLSNNASIRELTSPNSCMISSQPTIAYTNMTRHAPHIWVKIEITFYDARIQLQHDGDRSS